MKPFTEASLKNNKNVMRYYTHQQYFLDYHTIREELNISEAKLIRVLQALQVSNHKYKNQNLIAESDFLLITEAIRKNNLT